MELQTEKSPCLVYLPVLCWVDIRYSRQSGAGFKSIFFTNILNNRSTRGTYNVSAKLHAPRARIGAIRCVGFQIILNYLSPIPNYFK